MLAVEWIVMVPGVIAVVAYIAMLVDVEGVLGVGFTHLSQVHFDGHRVALC